MSFKKNDLCCNLICNLFHLITHFFLLSTTSLFLFFTICIYFSLIEYEEIEKRKSDNTNIYYNVCTPKKNIQNIQNNLKRKETPLKIEIITLI